MLVRDEGGELLLITQSDHAHLAGELLRLWRADDLSRHPRRDDLLFAAREHDNGWREADAVPRVDAETGRPLSFLDMPADVSVDIWRRGVRRHRERRPYAALLVYQHAIELFGHAPEEKRSACADFVAELHEEREALREDLGFALHTLQEDYRWIRLSDVLSLVLCGSLTRRFEACGYSGERRAEGVLLEPFPFAGSTGFEVPCRRVPSRFYGSARELAVALAQSSWTRVRVRAVGSAPASG